MEKNIHLSLKDIQGKLKAPKGQYNNFGKYKYRSAEDILEAVKPLVVEQDCALTISDDIVLIGNRIYVKATVTLINADGQSISTTAFAREEEQKKGMDGSQVTGASSSYARKYALNGLFCIDDTKDADALNTSAQYTEQQKSEQNPTDPYLEQAIANIKVTSSTEELKRIWEDCAVFQTNKEFMAALSARKKELKV